eukprot:TRINITY_DN1593_c0_g1_i2.p1 TRINITY_DN1593_c0_g1~~TRINITY_DN1593_c0_g1_i2.p1  ORF type:complete len:192 (-),score=63.36 TRINITY_DN1593_c0_g1_i2:66-641(-)
MDISSFVILPVVYFTKDLDWTDENLVFYARVAFVAAQLIGLLAYFLVRQKIIAKADDKKVKVKSVPSMSNPNPDPNEYITMTTQEYDLGKVKEAFQQILMTSLMISGIHYKWGYGVPLIIQFVTVPLNLYKNDLIKVHFLGQDIARPFPVPQSPFAALLEGGAAGGATPQEEERKRKKEEKKEQKKSKKVD